MKMLKLTAEIYTKEQLKVTEKFDAEASKKISTVFVNTEYIDFFSIVF